MIGGSICGQDLGVRRGIAFTPGEHAELVRWNTLILVHASLQVPAFELPSIRAGKGTGSKTADWRSLPITVIDHALNFRLLSAGVFERLPDRATPRRFWYRVTGKAKAGQRKNNYRKPDVGWFHGQSPGKVSKQLERFSSREC